MESIRYNTLNFDDNKPWTDDEFNIVAHTFLYNVLDECSSQVDEKNLVDEFKTILQHKNSTGEIRHKHILNHLNHSFIVDNDGNEKLVLEQYVANDDLAIDFFIASMLQDNVKDLINYYIHLGIFKDWMDMIKKTFDRKHQYIFNNSQRNYQRFLIRLAKNISKYTKPQGGASKMNWLNVKRTLRSMITRSNPSKGKTLDKARSHLERAFNKAEQLVNPTYPQHLDWYVAAALEYDYIWAEFTDALEWAFDDSEFGEYYIRAYEIVKTFLQSYGVVGGTKVKTYELKK